MGEADQNISCLNQNVFDVRNFKDMQPMGLIVSQGDLYFLNCSFNLNNDTLLMPRKILLSAF